jgi:succinoglycan biosynthesis protein ExoA
MWRALVVIPCLNEASHIEALVAQLLAAAGREAVRIVIVDGCSTDGTREIAERLAAADPRVIVLDNVRRIQSVAVNRAVEAHGDGAEFLIRIDAHASYPDDYCARLLAEQARTGADSVVVSMKARGEGGFQKAAAAAQNSVLGNGGSAHRNPGAGRWVDHGHHALMRTEAFRAVGGYDETFSHNEDAELDVRLGEAGYRIFLMGGEPIAYFPRSSLGSLFRQYLNYGRGRARNFLKHRQRPKLRQLALYGVAPAVGLLAFAPVWPVLAAPALGWSLVCLGYGAILGAHDRDVRAGASGVAAMAMHMGWSLGFLGGVFAQARRFGAGLIVGRERLGKLQAGDRGNIVN